MYDFELQQQTTELSSGTVFHCVRIEVWLDAFKVPNLETQRYQERELVT